MDGLVRGYLAELAQCAARDDTARPIEALAIEREPIGAIALDDHKSAFQITQIDYLAGPNALQLAISMNLQDDHALRRLEPGRPGELRAIRRQVVDLHRPKGQGVIRHLDRVASLAALQRRLPNITHVCINVAGPMPCR